MDRVLAHALFPSYIVWGPSGFNLLQRSVDLRLRVPAATHPFFPFPSSRSYSDLDGFWGQVSGSPTISRAS